MTVPLSPHENLAQLVRRAQAGDHAAFEELYRKTAQVQYFTIVGKVGEEAAADILQDVYLVAWRNIDKISPRSVVAYLNATTRNLCLKHLRDAGSPSAAKAATDDELDALSRRPTRTSESDPAEMMGSRDERERLRRALQEHLTDQERNLLLMRYYQNLKLTEISEETGLSLSTVKRSISRALATLKAKMGVTFLPLGFADLLAKAVSEPPAPHAEPPVSFGERAARMGSRIAAATALVVAAGAVAVAVLQPGQPEETMPDEPVPTAKAHIDTIPPTVAAQEIQNGIVVLTIADNESGVAATRCLGPDGTEYLPLENAPEAVTVDTGGTGSSAPVETGGTREAHVANAAGATGALRTFYFQLESGTYELYLTDAAGNTTHGPLEVQLYPEP